MATDLLRSSARRILRENPALSLKDFYAARDMPQNGYCSQAVLSVLYQTATVRRRSQTMGLFIGLSVHDRDMEYAMRFTAPIEEWRYNPRHMLRYLYIVVMAHELKRLLLNDLADDDRARALEALDMVA